MAFCGDSELYRRGAELRGEILGRERLEQALRDEDDLDVFYHLYGHECAYAQVWSRDGLPRFERALVIAAMLAALGPGSETLRVHTRGCVRAGATRAHLRQVLAMVTWYAGVPTGSQATATVRAALKAIPEPGAAQPASSHAPSDLVASGSALRRKILGVSATQASPSSAVHDAHERMQDTHYFGVLWANTDLTLKQRALVLLGVICGANRMHDAERWFAAALRLGCTAEELEELLLSAGVYCGELAYAEARHAFLSAMASFQSETR